MKQRDDIEQAEAAALSILAKIDIWGASFAEVQAAIEGALDLSAWSPSMLVRDAAAVLRRRWIIAANVNDSRPVIEAGNGLALMSAVNDCLTHGLVAPGWLAECFRKRVSAVADLRVKSWDDPRALGRPFRKGLQLDRAREVREKQLDVFEAVDAEIRNGAIVDNELFSRIGEAFGESITTTAAMYRSVKADFTSLEELIDRRKIGKPSR